MPVLVSGSSSAGAGETKELLQHQQSASSPHSSATSTPLDMLVVILRNVDGAFPPELRTNVCTLLTSLTVQKPSSSTPSPSGDEEVQSALLAMIERVKMATRGALESTFAASLGSGVGERGSGLVETAAKRTLEVWGPAP